MPPDNPAAFRNLHLLLLFLFPSLILPIALLNMDSREALAWATWVVVIFYAAFYGAYDALGGLHFAFVFEAAKRTGDPTITTFAQTNIGDPSIDLVQYVGALGWTATLGLTIVHWWRAGRRSPLLALLGVSAIALWWNHPGLPGAITYGSLALAALLLPLFGTRSRESPPPAADYSNRRNWPLHNAGARRLARSRRCRRTLTRARRTVNGVVWAPLVPSRRESNSRHPRDRCRCVGNDSPLASQQIRQLARKDRCYGSCHHCPN